MLNEELGPCRIVMAKNSPTGVVALAGSFIIPAKDEDDDSTGAAPRKRRTAAATSNGNFILKKNKSIYYK